LGTIYVDISNTGIEDGSLPRPYRTIPSAISASGSGSTISIASGTYPQAPMIFSKRGRVEARNGIVLITGLAGNAVMSQPADSARQQVSPDKR
jgi:hypothetical protein